MREALREKGRGGKGEGKREERRMREEGRGAREGAGACEHERRPWKVREGERKGEKRREEKRRL